MSAGSPISDLINLTPTTTSGTPTPPTASCSPVNVNIIAPNNPINCCQYYTAGAGDTVAVLVGLGLSLNFILRLNPTLTGLRSGLIPGDA